MGEKGSGLSCTGCESGLSIDESERIIVNGQLVRLEGLDGVMEDVRRMKIPQRKRIADELLIRAKARNPIPAAEERHYRDALMDEYDRRYLSVM